MSRKVYHDELKSLEAEVMAMARAVGEAVLASAASLKDRDISRSEEIIKNDALINRQRFQIEERCLLLIATQQPMAVDLRTIAAILSVITDLERIGDHAEGTAKINVMIGEKELVKPLTHIPQMAEKAADMLRRCMDAFTERDAETARAICAEDDVVDALYDEVYKDLILMMVKDPSIIQDATYLIWAAHNMERTADRVTNIAERVVFMATGKMEEMNVSRY